MKKTLNVRIEVSRLEKLHQVAEERKKTMTQLIEDWIDRLPKPVEKDSAHWHGRERVRYIPRFKDVGFAPLSNYPAQ